MWTHFFFSSRLFAAIGSQWAVLLGSFQALGLFLYWPVSRCAKFKGKVHWQVRGGGGGGGWRLRGQGVVQGGHWRWGVRPRGCDGGLGLRKWGWLQMLSMPHEHIFEGQTVCWCGLFILRKTARVIGIHRSLQLTDGFTFHTDLEGVRRLL